MIHFTHFVQFCIFYLYKVLVDRWGGVKDITPGRKRAVRSSCAGLMMNEEALGLLGELHVISDQTLPMRGIDL